jgi:arsenate reductase
MIPEKKPSLKTILFLCTGNSCRSQMAEAIVNSEFPDEWQALSAGTRPAGYVHPLAIKVLEEIGIHHIGKSKSVTEHQNDDFDLVVTVCDSAAEECPVWLRSGQQVNLPFPDPAKATGDQEEIVSVFRQVRDDIKIKIPQLLNDF